MNSNATNQPANALRASAWQTDAPSVCGNKITTEADIAEGWKAEGWNVWPLVRAAEQPALASVSGEGLQKVYLRDMEDSLRQLHEIVGLADPDVDALIEKVRRLSIAPQGHGGGGEAVGVECAASCEEHGAAATESLIRYGCGCCRHAAESAHATRMFRIEWPTPSDADARARACGFDNLSDALAHLEAAAGKAPTPSADRLAYEGAREDLLDWKGRAQRAEARLRDLGWSGIDASEPPTPSAPVVDDANDEAADVSVWSLIDIAEKCGAVKDASDDGPFWTLDLNAIFALEAKMRHAVSAMRYQDADPAALSGVSAPVGVEAVGEVAEKECPPHAPAVLACTTCKGRGEVEELTAHASGDPQDSYMAPATCPACGGEGGKLPKVLYDLRHFTEHCISAADEGVDYCVPRGWLEAATTLGIMEKVGRGKWAPTYQAALLVAALTPPAAAPRVEEGAFNHPTLWRDRPYHGADDEGAQP